MNNNYPTITKYAQQSPIPRNILLLLQREAIIQEPLTREDLIGLHLLEQDIAFVLMKTSQIL